MGTVSRTQFRPNIPLLLPLRTRALVFAYSYRKWWSDLTQQYHGTVYNDIMENGE